MNFKKYLCVCLLCDITFSSKMAHNNVLVYVLIKSNGSVLACDHGRMLEDEPGPVVPNNHGPLAASMQARHQLPSLRCYRKRNWASTGPLMGGCLGIHVKVDVCIHPCMHQRYACVCFCFRKSGSFVYLPLTLHYHCTW